MAHLVGAERIRFETPTRVILDELSIGLETGDRIGVVGRNGEGKRFVQLWRSGRVTGPARRAR